MDDLLPAVQEVEEEAPLAVIDGGPEMVGQLMQLAIEKGIDAASLERLVDIYGRERDRAAANEFAKALAEFQEECPAIAKRREAKITTKSGGSYGYRFASLDDIAKVARPLLHKRGLSFTWDSDVAGNVVTCICILRHENGHQIKSNFAVPNDSSAGMSAQQKVGSALTFAMRYSLVSVLGLTTTDDNMDAGPPPEKITAEQAASLDALIVETDSDLGKFLNYMGVDQLEQITTDKWARAINALKSKKNKQNGANDDKA